jgi:hypothetical protein
MQIYMLKVDGLTCIYSGILSYIIIRNLVVYFYFFFGSIEFRI